MQRAADAALLKQYVHIAVVVAAYWLVSISLVFVNKYLLSGDALKLNAPLFITWFQCVVTVLLCVFMSVASKLSHICFGNTLFAFAPIKINISELKKVLPVSLVFVAMISFNNLCLKYVDVSFYYIGRSLTTVFNVLLSYVMLNQRTSFPAILCCAVIVGGFFLGVDQEGIGGTLSLAGVSFGVLASLFVALNSIYIKKVLVVVKGDVSLLTYYNNVNACLLFPPLFLVLGEGSELLHFAHYWSPRFWLPLLISGFFGFGIGYLTSLQVKVTSPLTNNISGTAKACAQTVLASAFYNEIRSPLWWLSNGVVLAASAAYTRVKQLEMVAAAAKSIKMLRPTDIEKQRPDDLDEDDVDDRELLIESTDADEKDSVKRKNAGLL